MQRCDAWFVGVLLACACSATIAGPGYWTSRGPWGGDATAIHVPTGPTGSTTAYVTTRGGLFKTTDAGLSWSRADTGIPGGVPEFAAFAIDDLQPAILTTHDLQGRIYRSSDAGATWAGTGHAVERPRYPAALVDVPGDSDTLWLVLSFPQGEPASDTMLHKSTDGGATFTAVPSGQGLPAGLALWSAAVDPDMPQRILVGAADDYTGTIPASLFLSNDAGATWLPVLSFALGNIPAVVDIAFGPGSTVYALTRIGLHRSDDDGATWNERVDYRNAAYSGGLLVDPADPMVVLIGTIDGVLRSQDGGASASPRNAGLTSNASYTSVSDGTTVLPSTVTGLAAGPGWPAPGSLLWATVNGGGVFRSLDAASSWNPHNNGIAATSVRAVAVDPDPATLPPAPGAAGPRIFAGYGDTFQGSPAVFRSIDFGATWAVVNNQLRASQIRSIALDPTSPGVIYASGSSAAIPGYYNSGLYKSINGGVTWSILDGGLPTRVLGSQTSAYLGSVRTLVMDPRSCSVPFPSTPCTSGPLQRIYATATGFTNMDPVTFERHNSHRVIRSDDGGVTWINLDGDLPPADTELVPGLGSISYSLIPIPMVLGGSDPDVLYVGTSYSVSASPGTTVEDRPSGVFRSDDGGTTWVQRSGGLPRMDGFDNSVHAVLSLAIHPQDDDILWASVLDQFSLVPIIPLWKTVDGGLNWTPSASGLPANLDIRALLVDAGDPDIVYAGGYHRGGDDSGSFANPPGVFRSDDGGATWLSISGGLAARTVFAMTLDPFQPHVLHIGTNTGVWSLEQVPDTDGDGAPDYIENNAPDFGDGDGDGVPDSTQGAVGSTIVIFAAREKGAQAGVTVKSSPLEGTCTQNVDVQSLLAARYGRDYLPDGVRYQSYPRDLVRFEVLDCKLAQVDLIFHGADFSSSRGWTFRMYGPSTPGDDATLGWYDFSERAEVVAPNRWRLTLERDAMGSYRGGGESILFMGGPACHDPRIFADRLGDPVAPGCDD